MKKITRRLFFLTSLIIISCTTNDELPHDKIIGSWNLYKQTKNGVEQTLSSCDKQSNFIYRKDNTYTETIVRNGLNECKTVEIREGNWKNSGNGSYFKELKNGLASSNLDYGFENNNIHFVYYTVNNNTYYVYYKRN